jgi:hypothetical protein
MSLEIQRSVSATFAGHIDSAFRLSHEHGTTELRLIEVTDGSTDRQVSFSLLFRGPRQPLLAQQIYAFEHNRLGRFDLFIVPVKQDAHGLYYEAVVNRMIEAAPATNDRP